MNKDIDTAPFPTWIIVVLAAAMACLAAGGIWFYNSQARAARNQATAHLAEIGQRQTEAIAAWRRTQLETAAAVMDIPFISREVTRFLTDPRENNARQLQNRFISLPSRYHYTNILVLDSKGRILSGTPQDAENLPIDPSVLKQAFHRGEPVFAPMHMDDRLEKPCISIVVPVFGQSPATVFPDFQPLGTVILTQTADQTLYPLLQNWPAAAATAETLLVRRDKEDVLFLTNLGMYPGTALKLRVPLAQKDVLVVMAALGRQGVVQGKDYRGVDVVSVLLPVPDSPWFIVAKQDTAEVFAQWRDHARFLLTLFAALAGGLVVLGLLAWQEHQMARYKRLYRTEARLRREAKQANAALLEAEEEREKLDAQFQQSQKMESVGRLAGGVAHDYNNMLNVILGYAELALGKIDPGDPLHDNLEKIHGAATRSADITRQLLAFARKQTIDPKVLDLNRTIDGGILQILHRLMGEDIDLAWQPAETLWSVKMDPVQIDQILANLCVNARDAIADVGKITIETGTKTFDQAYCDDHPGFIPGDFVMLAVSDDGCGMDKQTRENMFEPFFTTKKAEKGTGLGLATVYGIVKQNNGFINVYSEPGKGTTIRIYLSRHTEQPEQIPPGKQTRMPSGHGETVLVVEDEIVILDLACAMLENLGYTALAAASPDQALNLAQSHAGKIHLVITDVVMPGMNGRDLAAQLTQLYPDLRVLFMSGYTANVIAHHGVLDPGVHFMQKPFSMEDIAAKVQEVMNGALL